MRHSSYVLFLSFHQPAMVSCHTGGYVLKTHNYVRRASRHCCNPFRAPYASHTGVFDGDTPIANRWRSFGACDQLCAQHAEQTYCIRLYERRGKDNFWPMSKNLKRKFPRTAGGPPPGLTCAATGTRSSGVPRGIGECIWGLALAKYLQFSQCVSMCCPTMHALQFSGGG